MKALDAAPIQTPATYGAVRPAYEHWPLNEGDRWRYRLVALYPTIQGEGLNGGRAMTIVRLQGCPVGCVWCDTPESWDPTTARLGIRTADEIARQVADDGLGWALVTGGEPTWHDLTRLTGACRGLGIKTALETAGVMPVSGTWSWITLSPKPLGQMRFLPTWLALANELKWIVGNERDLARLRGFLRAFDPRDELPILVQPLSAKPGPTRLCVEAVLSEPRWRLSLQTHKLLEIA